MRIILSHSDHYYAGFFLKVLQGEISFPDIGSMSINSDYLFELSRDDGDIETEIRSDFHEREKLSTHTAQSLLEGDNPFDLKDSDSLKVSSINSSPKYNTHSRNGSSLSTKYQ